MPPTTTKPSLRSRFLKKLKLKDNSKKKNPISAETPEESGASDLENDDDRKLTQTSQSIPGPGPTDTPWENWELDQDFFDKVYQWNSAHPERTLSIQFRDVLDRHADFLELVPDGPIPFRGFAKALAHIIKLGTDVANARDEALRFALSVLQWVEKLAAAFKEAENGRSLSKAWESLSEIRNVIEDTCKWAREMLENPNIMDRYAVQSKIIEYEKKFTLEVERFGVVNDINLAVGQDAIIRKLDTILQNDDQKVTKTTSSTYREQKKAPCDPRTRETILKKITDWASNTAEGSHSFLWLSGDPGVGKSAITASITKICQDEGILWAQFFINRNDASTTDPLIYFPSVFQQISNRISSIPGVTPPRNPPQWDPQRDISEQAKDIFPKILQLASAACPNKPIVIVIDALDETHVERTKEAATIFSKIVVALPNNVKVFIASRVENVIRKQFKDLGTHVTHIHVTTEESTNDVALYLSTKMGEIMEEQEIDESLWGERRMKQLCDRASGLFIWAVTAIKYIQARIEDSGKECFSSVLGELNSTGMEDINRLYLTILERCLLKDSEDSKPLDTWPFQRFRRIIGAILVQQEPLSIGILETFLGMQHPTTKSPVDIQHFVRRLRTVLVGGVEQVNAETIPRVHKSFVEFITGHKAQSFRVLINEAHGEFAIQCLRQFSLFWVYSFNDDLNLQYAAMYLSEHLRGMSSVRTNQEMATYKFEFEDLCDDSMVDSSGKRPVPKICPPSLRERANFPLPAHCELVCRPGPRGSGLEELIIKTSQESVLWRYPSRHFSDGSSVDLSGKREKVLSPMLDVPFLSECPTFFLQIKFITSMRVSREVRIITSETGERVSNTSEQPNLMEIEYMSNNSLAAGDLAYNNATSSGPGRWSESPAILNTHTDIVQSSSTKKVLSSSRDFTIRIWDWNYSASPQCYLISGFTSQVNSAHFSRLATHVVSAHDDGTIIVWNVDKTEQGEELKSLKVASSRILCAFFSTTSRYIIVCSSAYDITLWDWENGKELKNVCPDDVLGFTQPGSLSHIAIPRNMPDTQEFYSYRVGKSAYLAQPPDGPWFYYNGAQNFFMSLAGNRGRMDIKGFLSPQAPFGS